MPHHPTACRRPSNSVVLAVLCALVLDVPASALGKPLDTPSTPWPMDRLRLKERDEVLEGLIDVQSSEELDFIQIVRPPGRPMYLLVRPVSRRAIASIERIPANEREQLMRRIAAFRNRARIEAGRDVRLRRIADEERLEYRYQGRWFVLESTLDESTTRQVVVRLEQLFRGFRQVLPTAADAVSTDMALTIQVYGRRREYVEYLLQTDLSPNHPAVFDVAQNRIVAGSVFAQIAADVDRLAQESQAMLVALDIPGKLQRRDEELRAGGMPRAKREAFKKFYGRQLRALEKELKDDIRKANQRNKEILEQEMAGLFRRLHHEATHAYLQRQLYPGPRYEIPRWLNEGLAQIFETAIIEAGDQLRLDAPDPQLLSRLQDDLAGGRPLPLADVLRADQESFLVPHRSDPSTSNRHYLYAWGLAYYLIFLDASVGRAELDQYVADDPEASADPVGRFEQLVGRPLDRFEAQWIATMLGQGASGAQNGAAR